MTLEAYYTLETRNIETGEVKVVHTQKNLITDYGLNYFGSGSKTTTANQNWTLNDCGVWLKDFPEPSIELAELKIPYRTGIETMENRTKFLHNVGNSGSSPSYGTSHYDDGQVCYMEETRTYTFPHKYLVGDMYGVYLGCFQQYGDSSYIKRDSLGTYPWLYNPKSTGHDYVYDHVFSVFSAIKFKDASGLSKSIPITEIEQLFIRYTLRRYLPKYAAPKKYSMTTSLGTSHEVTVEPRWWISNYAGTTNSSNYYSPFRSYTNSRTYSELGYESVVSFEGSGTYSNYDNVGVFGYVKDSLKQASRFSYDLNDANGKIKHIDVSSNMGTMRVSFNPPVVKNNERKFNFVLEWTWGREEDLYINRDEIVLVNPNFETDLTGWTTQEGTLLVQNEISGKPTVYLSGTNKTEVISQELPLDSLLTLEDKRLSLTWEMASKNALIGDIMLEYKKPSEEELAPDELVHAQTITGIMNNSSLELSKHYTHFRIPVEALGATKVEVKIKMRTNTSDPFLALTNIQSFISNMTPVTG